MFSFLIDIIEAETSNETIEIPESHKKSIDIGLSQIKAGNTYTNEKVMKRVQKWAEK